MNINASKLALSVAIVAAVTYAACWALVAVMPDAAMTMTEDMLHMHMADVTWHLTPRSLLLGTAAWAALAGGVAWLIGKLYNSLCSRVHA